MKRIIVGGISFFSGIMLYGFTIVAAAVYALSTDGYYAEISNFNSSLQEIGIIPLVISSLLVITGLVIILSSFDEVKSRVKDWMSIKA